MEAAVVRGTIWKCNFTVTESRTQQHSSLDDGWVADHRGWMCVCESACLGGHCFSDCLHWEMKCTCVCTTATRSATSPQLPAPSWLLPRCCSYLCLICSYEKTTRVKSFHTTTQQLQYEQICDAFSPVAAEYLVTEGEVTTLWAPELGSWLPVVCGTTVTLVTSTARSNSFIVQDFMVNWISTSEGGCTQMFTRIKHWQM